MAFTKKQLETLAAPLRRVIFDKDTIAYLEWVKDNPNEWAQMMQQLDEERDNGHR